MEQITNQLKLEDNLKDRFKSLPKTMEEAGQIFNYVAGGYEVCDNVQLTGEEIEAIIEIIKKSASLDTDVSSKSARFYQEQARKIEDIIDKALER
jgi:DNA-directed RNA polymerase subunit F